MATEGGSPNRGSAKRIKQLPLQHVGCSGLGMLRDLAQHRLTIVSDGRKPLNQQSEQPNNHAAGLFAGQVLGLPGCERVRL